MLNKLLQYERTDGNLNVLGEEYEAKCLEYESILDRLQVELETIETEKKKAEFEIKSDLERTRQELETIQEEYEEYKTGEKYNLGVVGLNPMFESKLKCIDYFVGY